MRDVHAQKYIQLREKQTKENAKPKNQTDARAYLEHSENTMLNCQTIHKKSKDVDGISGNKQEKTKRQT